MDDPETRAIELQNWISGGSDSKSPIVQCLWTMAVIANDADFMKKLLDAHADLNTPFDDG